MTSHQAFSATNTLGGSLRSSRTSLQCLDDMVTSGAFYKRRGMVGSGIGETRSMTGEFGETRSLTGQPEQAEKRSLHLSYSVSSAVSSRASSFRSAYGRESQDYSSSDGVII